MSYNILIVDNDRNYLRIAKEILEKGGQYKTTLANNAQEAIDFLSRGASGIDLVLLDMNIAGTDAVSVISAMKPLKRSLPIVINSDFDDIALITKALKAGATDFVRKVDSTEKLCTSIQNALRAHVLHEEMDAARQSIAGEVSFNDILGDGPLIKEAKTLGMRAATSNIPVLIEGENGCGKELLARSIHFAKDGADRPFITVNCGAIPENLVESILFGHEKGAFTGAIYKTYGKFREADGGTIFLDEVGELSPDIQVKLLRVLQDGEVDPVGSAKPVKVNVRLISATNRNLANEVKNGNFREDLYYRLNVFPIYVPSLRDRRSDLPIIIDHFLKFSARSENKNIKEITKDAQEMLYKYSWPGNIRQLKNFIFRAVVLCDREVLDITDFPRLEEEHADINNTGNDHVGEHDYMLDLKNSDGHFKHLADIEKQVIEAALKRYNGRMSETARRLGIGRSTLYRKLEVYGFEFNHYEQ